MPGGDIQRDCGAGGDLAQFSRFFSAAQVRKRGREIVHNILVMFETHG
jgi:hypothetical protein